MDRIRKNNAIAILFIGFFLLLLTAGCTSTEAYTSASDDLPRVASESEVFLIGTSYLGERHLELHLERTFINYLERYGFKGYAWDELFPPFREYSDAEKLRIVEEQNVDIVVYAKFEDSETSGYVGHIFLTFEFYSVSDLDNPVLFTQITATGDEYTDWEMIFSAATKRAVREYFTLAGIEPIPTPNKE